MQRAEKAILIAKATDQCIESYKVRQPPNYDSLMTTTLNSANSLYRLPGLLDGQRGPLIDISTKSLRLKEGESSSWGLCVAENEVYVGGLHNGVARGHGQWHSSPDKVSYIGGWKGALASGGGSIPTVGAMDVPVRLLRMFLRFLHQYQYQYH